MLKTTALVATVVMVLISGASTTQAATITLDPLQLTWMRVDQPVASGHVSRTWLWGPQTSAVETTEDYAEAPGNARQVVYYDKARMEVTDPQEDPNSIWHVTNGLLVMELMTGQLQTGDAQFEARQPADINAAGDSGAGNGPSYATLGQLRAAPAAANGAVLEQRLDASGAITDDPAMADYDARAAQRVTVAGIDHQVASPFWDFMNAHDIVYVDGAYVEDGLFANPFYATGYPVTEAYWTSVQVGGVPHNVLLQCFERRCLTYTPGNAPGWQVEAGNVGLHYYEWRYGEPRPAPSTLSVAFNVNYAGQRVATTTTHETFLGNTAIGTWETTDSGGATISKGTLIAEHSLLGVDASITQDWPIAGSATLSMTYALGLGGVEGTGTLDYTAQLPDGAESGSLTFSASSATLDVWEVELSELPPVFFFTP
jgi:hypothetical protein